MASSSMIRAWCLTLGVLLCHVPSAISSRSLRMQHVRFSTPVAQFEKEDCITEPVEFLNAFLLRENKCVDLDILVRLQSDGGWGGAANARELFKARTKARPVTFFSYDDTPAKYLRIGPPQDLGNFNELPPLGGNADATFEGLEFLSNFLAMLEQLGYDAPSSYITGTYALIVTKRPKRHLHNTFIPTWKNVVSYYSSYLSWVAQDPTFALNSKIVGELTGKTFGNLTGCPTTCTFEDLEFPSDIPRPAINGKRKSPTQCINPNATRFVLTEPTGFDDWEVSCGQLWKDAKAFADKWCTNANNITIIKAFGAQLVQKLKTLDSVTEQTAYFRAYLNTACGGSFNTLFSGNGFTYTGAGGLIAPTGSEILVAAAPHLNLDNDISFLRDTHYLYFCSDGQFSKDPNFKCPTSK